MELHRLLLSILALFTPASLKNIEKYHAEFFFVQDVHLQVKGKKHGGKCRKNVDSSSVSLLHRGFRYDSNTCKTLEVKKSARGQPPNVTYRPLRRREIVSCLPTYGSASVAKLLCQSVYVFKRCPRRSSENL